MPLSEHEQRILSEIEQRLYESDPRLAREVRSTTVYTTAFRGLKWALAGFVVGVVIMIATLSISFILAFVGFLIMLGCALLFVQSLRRLGHVGWQQITQRHLVSDGRGHFFGAGQRVRGRFKNDESAE